MLLPSRKQNFEDWTVEEAGKTYKVDFREVTLEEFTKYAREYTDYEMSHGTVPFEVMPPVLWWCKIGEDEYLGLDNYVMNAMVGLFTDKSELMEWLFH